jgi:hypothetical protein
MTIVISYQLNKIPRAVGIMIMGIAAIIVFFLSFLFKKLLASNFKICFEDKQAIISSKNINRVILYENIEKLEIRNNTDYSYLLFLEKDGKKTKIFVGMANLGMKTSTILTPADQLDPFFGKPDFEKRLISKKAWNIFFIQLFLTNPTEALCFITGFKRIVYMKLFQNILAMAVNGMQTYR